MKTQNTTLTVDQERCLSAWNSFSMSEYGNEEEKEFPKDGIFHVAYTTYGFNDDEDSDEHEIQVNYNFKDLCWENYIDGELVLVELANHKAFIEDMEGASFEDIIRSCVYKGFEMYGEEE